MTTADLAVRAGDSQSHLVAHARAMVAEYARLLSDERERLARHTAAWTTERRVGVRLEAMSAWGWRLLPDRAWPGTRGANIDMIHVGPGGVLVIDVKCWAEPRIVDGRLWRGQVDATEDVEKLLAVTGLVQDAVAVHGLAPEHVRPVLVVAGPRSQDLPPASLGLVLAMGERRLVPWAAGRVHRMDGDQVTVITDELARVFPPHRQRGLPVVPRTPVPALERVPDPGVDEQLELFDRAEYERSIVQAARAGTIEDWMTFIHPDQLRVVRRSTSGPSRISGAAGTGKTVVALHRTAHLASTRPGRILFTTYVRTLPRVLAAAYTRLSPRTADRVEFTNLRAWALRFLRDRGVRHGLDHRRAQQTFEQAWRRVGEPSVLGDLRVPAGYWREEVETVLKGRGLTSFAQYRDLARVGRRMPLRPEHREAVWDLHVAYERALREARLHDFADILCLALAELRRQPLEPGYSAVVVDEVQDVTMVAAQVVHALVGDAPDGLLLVGDGHQSVYPGGFTLREAGIAVHGRSTVLRTNYRNTTEVLTAAAQYVADDDVDELDGASAGTGATVTVLRDGGAVERCVSPTARAHDLALTSAVQAAASETSLGDCAVLTRTTKDAERYRTVLVAAGVAVLDLEQYEGATSEQLKVGTIKRAKGLEFKRVFLPWSATRPPRQGPDEPEAAFAERRDLTRRETYVGMTRARDRLWLGFVAT